MAETKIEWADVSWNPISGCTKVSEGCRNCYAERMSKRLAGRCGYPKDKPFQVTLHPEKLDELAKWKKPRRIFVNSMSDLFHDEVPFEFIRLVWARMVTNRQHTYMILTKRPKRMVEFFEWMSRQEFKVETLWPNIWLGVSVENQAAADERIPLLLQTPAVVKFISAEPMIGPVDLGKWIKCNCPGDYYENGGHNVWCPRGIKNYVGNISWVICGGETGPGARPMHPDWVRSLRDQCQAARVPFFFKSWGEWEQFYDRDKDDPDWANVPEEGATTRRLNLADGHGFHGDGVIYLRRVGKKKAGRILDGRTWEEIPEVK